MLCLPVHTLTASRVDHAHMAAMVRQCTYRHTVQTYSVREVFCNMTGSVPGSVHLLCLLLTDLWPTRCKSEFPLMSLLCP